MEDIPNPHSNGPMTPDKERVRAQYQRLRRDLVAQHAAAAPDAAAIYSIMEQLGDAHMNYKATFGLGGNNPYK